MIKRESKMTRKMVDYSSRDSPYILVGHQGDEYSPDIVDTLRCLKEKIKSCKANKDRLIETQERFSRAQEKQLEVNAVNL